MGNGQLCPDYYYYYFLPKCRFQNYKFWQTQRMPPVKVSNFCISNISAPSLSLSLYISFSHLFIPLSLSISSGFLFFSFSLMERPGSEGFGGRRRRLVKNEVPIAPPRPLRRTSSLPAAAKPPPPEVKLAAVAVDLNVRLRSADMSPAMQERAFRFARFLLDAHSDNVPPPTQLAMRLKKVRLFV